jgi:integrase
MQRGTIIERPTQAGDLVFYGQFRDATKKQVREVLGRRSEGMTKRKAEAELAERCRAVAKSGYIKPTPVTFAGYAWAWLERGEVRSNWKPRTVVQYRTAVKRLVAQFGSKRLHEIRRSAIKSFLDELLADRSPQVVNLAQTIMHQILAEAVADELVDTNQADGIKRPRAKRYKPRRLTPEELALVESRLEDSQVRLAFRVFYTLGIRFSELQGLRWRDVDLVGQRLRIEDSKTPTGERVVHLPPGLRDALARQKEGSWYDGDGNYVFCHPHKGSRWHPDFYREPVNEAYAALGIEARPAHDLRVTSITAGVQNGEHPSKIMARVGHTSYDTTKVYIDLVGEVFPE